MRTLKITFFFLLITLGLNTNVFGQNLFLNVSGKDSLETKTIDSLKTKSIFKDYGSLKQEADSITLRLQKIGYIESELISIDKKNDSVYSAYYALKTKFDTIYIYHNNFLPDDILENLSIDDSKSYFKVTASESEALLKLLNSKLSEKGDPFSSLQLINIKTKNKNTLQADLSIISNRKRTIDSIVVKGYEKFPYSYLNRYLKIRKGQEFNLEDIKSKIEELNNLVFANQIREPGILFTKDSTKLYLYLEKSPSNSFDGFLGFGNNENTNKIKFNGYLNLNLINNLNYGESVKFIYKSDENEQRTIDINTKLPYLFKSPLGLELGLNIFKKDSTFNSVNQSAKLFYQINNRAKIYSGIEILNSDNLLDNTTNIFVQDYKSTFFSLSFEFENYSKSVLFPYNSYLLLKSNFGKREIENQPENQTSLHYRALKIFNLNDKNSIYLNSEGKMLFSDDYLTNELFRFGGINSIRGFEENSLFASLFSVINTEYRYLLSKNIYVNSIIDAAYYENQTVNIKEKLFSFGFGLGMVTKAGLFKLNYSNGLSENQVFKFNNSKIHISLSASF